MDTTTIVAVIVVLALAALLLIGATLWSRGRRSKELRARFGPEYDRTLSQAGSRTGAEQELDRRAKRVEKLHLRPLAPERQEHFVESWWLVQSHFVDNPDGTIAEADVLVQDLMRDRGYPITDFETQAKDISVDHPEVVSNYRAAHAIAINHEDGASDTEDLRQAMIHFRALFEDLLGPAAKVA